MLEPAMGAWYLGTLISFGCVYVLACITSGLSAVRYALRARRFAKEARLARAAASEETVTLDDGDTVLYGCVEYDSEYDHAVVVTIEQSGTESESSGSWTIAWQEQRRKTTVAPFYVVHASGVHVRVEPDKDTKLEKEIIAKVERTELDRRKRIASIAAGESVWVTGVLAREAEGKSGGYRGGPAWVMRPSRGEPMVVSTLQPEERLTRNQRVSKRMAVAFALTFIATMVLQPNFHALVFDGHQAVARVTCVENIFVDDGPNRCKLIGFVNGPRAQMPDDWDTECQTPPLTAGATFPCVASFTMGVSLPGTAPRARGVPVLVTFIEWLALVIVGRVTRTRKRWFEGARVDDSASGRLAD